MNCHIKNLIVLINNFHKKFVLPSSNMDNVFIFKKLQNQLVQCIHIAKQMYFNKISKKLCDPLTRTKCYWLQLKTILNRKKVPCIPPIFHRTSMSQTLKKRVKFSILFFFANQCSLIPNNSILPSELMLLTKHILIFCDLSETGILQIINQDLNKADGHDMISICMLKLCGEAIRRPLNISFKTCLNKESVKNYCPVSLLYICGKIFECLIYNVMYDLLSNNNLLSPNQ